MSSNKYEHGGMIKTDKIFSASSRFKPYEYIAFDPPLIGANGNKLVGYQWQYEWTMLPNFEGELVSKRVSNWEQSSLNDETGRQIVHQYHVETPDGKNMTVSSESVPVVLGIIEPKQKKQFANLANASKTLAKQELELIQLKEKNRIISEAKQEIIAKGYPDFYGELTSYNIRWVMGDASVRQNGKNREDEESIVAQKKIDPERLDTLKSFYVKEELKKMGIDRDYMYSTYDLSKRIERQQKKIKDILLKKETMEDGGIIDPAEAFQNLKEELGVSTFKPPVSISAISQKHGVTEDYLYQQLQKGIAVEQEHLGDHAKDIDAETIALHHLSERPDYYELLEKVESAPKTYAKGGTTDIKHISGSAGGMLVGKSHKEGGIQAINKSTGQPLEMEGGEAVITKNAVSDTTKREFEGEMLTNREILSRINESGGGVRFEEGGQVPVSCACDDRQYNYKGKKMELGAIIDDMNLDGEDFYRKEYMVKMIQSYKSKYIPLDLATVLAHTELVSAEIPHEVIWGGFTLNGLVYGGYTYIKLYDGTIIDYYAGLYLGLEESPIAPTGWGRQYFGSPRPMKTYSLEEVAELLSAVALHKIDIIKKYVQYGFE